MKDLKKLRDQVSLSPLAPLLPFAQDDYIRSINHGDLGQWLASIDRAPELKASVVNFDDVIRIGTSNDANSDELTSLESLLLDFIPWRKGPFSIFGIEIDTEWKSNIKWARLQNKIEPLQGRKVLDVGSGNGYYSLRMMQAGAQQVIGIDPHLAYVIQFWLLKKYIPDVSAFVLPLTLEQLPSPLPYFDTVFSMGVIYHRRSPIDHIMQLKSCLRQNGQLVIESIVVDGNEGYSLTPGKRYARMSNVWFLPSVPTLVNWLSKCGFTDIQIADESTTDLNEQRKTKWMPFGSLDDALSLENPAMTREGYPAPKRAVITAIKP
ncbi:MAG: tRNA 5-methoxyuridine(34)/uridine 5-oxyacetic acid(34) synthase CmoB [Pseudohongiellaceae bacterium]